MGWADPKKNKEGYKNQKRQGAPPVTGEYDVVNKAIQFQKIGRNGTTKLRIITHTLRVVDAIKGREDDAKEMVGNTFGQDIWWHNPTRDDPPDLEDCDYNLIVNADGDGPAFNGQKIINMAIACGCDDDITDDIVKRDLAKHITGVPYRVKIDVSERNYKDRNGNERTAYDLETLEVRRLSGDVKKKYTSSPDFGKVLDKLENRTLDPADYSNGGGGSSGSSKAKAKDNKTSDDDFYDDDLPF